jgi:hypothetical protein
MVSFVPLSRSDHTYCNKGSISGKKMESLVLSKYQCESFWNECLFRKQMEIEIWTLELPSKGKSGWSLSRRVS